MAKNKLLITDTTLRDAQQSIWSKHINLNELKPILKKLDDAGFDALEVWGGGTFEACLRVWKEDPWERLRFIKQHIKKTPLQMILRGQHIVGYHFYPDDVMEEFIKKSVEHGISIIRIFDALNDIENMKLCVELSKKYKTKVEGVIAYTQNSFYDNKFFINYAQELEGLGVDAIVIKDAAGLLTPKTIIELIKSLKENVSIPIYLHSHLTTGLINITYYEAIKNGIDGIDTTFGAFSLPAAQPAIENILTMCEENNIATALNSKQIYKISEELFTISRNTEVKTGFMSLNDHTIYSHQLPRGAYTFLYKQLKDRNALDKFNLVLEEIPKVRKELGSPPMLIPVSQIIVAQAVHNVLTSQRYKFMSMEAKNLIKGLYGTLRGKVDKNILQITNISKQNINRKKANILSPILEKIKTTLDPKFVKAETDYLTYALFPDLALDFFKYRLSPHTENLITTREITVEEEILSINKLMTDNNVTEFELNNDNQYVFIKRGTDTPTMSHPVYMMNNNVPPQQTCTETSQTLEAVEEKQESVETSDQEKITSPIVGVFYSKPSPDAQAYVKEGDIVQAGQTVCIVEAMKVMNEIKSPFKCKITKFTVQDKDSVEADQALFFVEKL